MKQSTLATALSLGLVGLTPAAFTVSAQSVFHAMADVETITGEIEKIDAEKKTFIVKTDELATSIMVNDKTVFTLDGKEVEMSEALKVGRTVVVVHEDRTATRVDATS